MSGEGGSVQLKPCGCDWDVTVEELLEGDAPLGWVRLVSQDTLGKEDEQKVVDAICNRRALLFDSWVPPEHLAERREADLENLASIMLRIRSGKELLDASRIILLAKNLDNVHLEVDEDLMDKDEKDCVDLAKQVASKDDEKEGIGDVKHGWHRFLTSLDSSMVQTFSSLLPRYVLNLLAGSVTVTDLDLSGSRFNSEAHIQGLRQLLLRTKSLKRLSLACTELCYGGLEVARDAFCACTTLLRLDLSGNRSIRSEDLFFLSNALSNRKMESIALSAIPLHTLGVAFIVQNMDVAILHLGEFDVPEPRLRDADTAVLSMAIRHRARPRHHVFAVYLDKLLGLTPKGTDILTETMKTNPGLILYAQNLTEQEAADYKYATEFSKFLDQQEANLFRLDTHHKQWSCVAFAIAFARANLHHPFLASFIPITKLITALCNL